MAPRPAPHDHLWYAIAWRDTLEPAVYACAVRWSCISTLVVPENGKHPDVTVPTPVGGLWGSPVALKEDK